MTVEADRGALAFAEKLLGLLGEGRFTATYKYAVMLGLMDLCLEGSTRGGAAPSSVTSRQLAAKILELYWPHAVPFRGKRVLLQNSGARQAGILSLIVSFRESHGARAGATLSGARRGARDALAALEQDVEWILVQMPLPKLQRIGSEVHAFFYQIAWDDGVTRSQFRSSDFDNVIHFVGSSGEHLVRLSGLLRPLVQRQWAARVAQFNCDLLDDPEIERFLFGAERKTLSPVRRDLRELQASRCFYCEDPLNASAEVDHFVPWSRYPDNGIDNLVVAHATCNRAKRDHLAEAAHVDAWLRRMRSSATDLATIAERRAWERDPARSEGVARSIYLRLPADVRLWQLGDHFVSVDRRRLIEAFAT